MMSELSPAILQAAVTLGLAALCALLFRRYGKPHYAWWTAAWVLYSLRLGAIARFLISRHPAWLYWHQVLTGWTALALLGAASSFVMVRSSRRTWIIAALFPPAWSLVAIYGFESFLLAALPAVGFLAGVTLWTSFLFARHWAQLRAPGARMLAIAFALWGIHHLDYPFLRAQGAWVPWGYYLDILFTLGVAASMIVLVLDDLQQGIGSLSALGEASSESDVTRETVARPLSLPAVRGTALFVRDGASVRCLAAAGECQPWEITPPDESELAIVRSAMDAARFQQVRDGFRLPGTQRPMPFAAVLPLFPSTSPSATSALVIVGEARAPFAALDERFLLALGHQAGAAIERDEMRRGLASRSAELERLSVRMIAQHEEERRRVAMELHDETAQVLAAVKLQLGLARERADAALDAELSRALDLIDTGMKSIRGVTRDLRPALLDDLGLVAAMRSLILEFAQHGALDARLLVHEPVPPLDESAELALFRALQELLANAARHGRARHVEVGLAASRDGISLVVEDDGIGLPPREELARLERLGHLGLAGVRERITSLGGRVQLGTRAGGGTRVEIEVPRAESAVEVPT